MTPPPGALTTLPAPAPRAPGTDRCDPVGLGDWCCENCEASNPGRRRRCWDCRTSRY